MIWNFMLFVVHLAAMIGFIYLFESAPCWMQKVAVALWVVAMFAVAAGYLIDFGAEVAIDLGWWGGEHVRLFGFVVEHIALLLYVFRLIYQQHLPEHRRDARSWSNSLPHSPA